MFRKNTGLFSFALIMIASWSAINCEERSIVLAETAVIFSVAGNISETLEVKGLNKTVFEEELVPLGQDPRRNLTFDDKGYPIVSVDDLQIAILGALLMEHDERFHYDFPGHKTIMPTRVNLEDSEERENNVNKQSGADAPDQPPILNEGINKNDYTSNELLPDGHIASSQVDPSLMGHVDPQDEDDLREMIVDKPPKLVRSKRAYFSPDGYLWPKGEYVYVFDRSLTDTAKNWLLKAFRQIGQKVPCVKFKKADANSRRYIVHTGQNNGQCFSSTLGYVQGRQTIVNVGNLCGQGTTGHEVFHALGAIHTQNRPDRDKYVTFNWQNIQQQMMSNFQKVRGRISATDNEYDYKSTMHYPTYSFPINPNVPTVYPKNSRVRIAESGSALFDELDYETLRKWYGCSNADKRDDSKDDSKDDSNDKPKPRRRRRRKRKRKGRSATPRWSLASNSFDTNENSDCIISPWGEWSECEAGNKTKKRTIDEDARGNGLPCPKELTKILRCRESDTVQDTIQDTIQDTVQDTIQDTIQDFDDEVGRALTNMKKKVTVVEGAPIILVVGNPKNFPVKWYRVVGGEDVELPTDTERRYQTTRTDAGNNRLTIENSTNETDDGALFVTKVLMSKSVLRVAWSIDITSEDEHLSGDDSS